MATMRARELRVAVDLQRGVGGLARLQGVERLAEQEHALGGAADELGRLAAGGADAAHQRARAAPARLDAVAQLDAREHGEAAFVLPEAGFAEPRQQLGLLRVPAVGVDALGDRGERLLEHGRAPRCPRGRACAARPRPSGGGLGGRRVGVDEGDLQAVPAGARRTGTGRRPGRRARRSPAPAASGSAARPRASSGRAPRSGVKPSASRNSSAESSNSTAHWRPRRPRRASTASSSLDRISRMIGRDSGRKTTVRSMRLRNSRPERARHRLLDRCPPRTRRSVGEKPSPGRSEIFAPEVRGHDDHGVAEVRGAAARVAQPAVVEDLQEQVPDARVGLLELVQQHDRERLAADPADQRGVVDVARRRACAARVPGFWYSLMSSRIIRSPEPKRYSASALAISVLPVPVGPTNSSTACGRVGIGQARLEQRDALDHALDGLGLADHARAEEHRAARRRRAARARRAATRGRPERSEIVPSTSSIVSASSPAAGAASRRSATSSEPGSAASPRKWRPSASASRSTGLGVSDVLRAASASERASSIGVDAHDVERVAHLRPRAHQPLVARPGRRSRRRGCARRPSRPAAGPARRAGSGGTCRRRAAARSAGTIQITSRPSSVAHEVAHAALELADVGHPGVDLGRAGLERHPALARRAGPPPRAARLRRPLPGSPTTISGLPARIAAASASISSRERLVDHRAQAELDHLAPARRARPIARSASTVCAVGVHARELGADRGGIASPSAARGSSASSSWASATSPTSIGSVAAPRDRLEVLQRRLAPAARPALAKIAVISPSPMWRSSARSRKTVRCPRTTPISAFSAAAGRLRGRRASASSATAPAIASSAPAVPAARRPPAPPSARRRAGRPRSRSSAAARRCSRGSARRVSSASSSSRHRSPASSS